MERTDAPRGLLSIVVTAAITAVVATAAFLWWVQTHPQLFAQLFRIPPVNTEETGGDNAPYAAEAAVIDTVTKTNPAVVAITISKNVPVYEQYYESVPSPWSDFFGNGFNFSVPRVREKGTEKKEVGGGSGFLVSQNGYIITNRHVVADEEAEYAVFMNDGKQYAATVVARDPVLDLAVIKIDGTGLPYLSFGDSDTIQVGQTVITIGNALAEFRNTVSVGVVSGLARSIVASNRSGQSEALDQLIQTDAAINQGNSGGPLLNLSGEVIGVNVAVASGAENIGFAVSGNSAKSVIESVQRTGRIVRPYLGVRYVPVTLELKEEKNLPVDYGMFVSGGTSSDERAVIPGSPADKAGIVENDIILEVDGTKLTPDRNLAAIIRGKKVGDTVDLKVLQKGEERNIRVTLEEMK